MKSLGLSVLSSMGDPSGLSPSELGSPESPARCLPTSRKFTDLSARTNNLRGAFECLLEASWACATKKLLDVEGHLTGPTENPLRALGKRTFTKGMSTGNIFCRFYWLHTGRRQKGMVLGLV